jgi:hypothetical protein
LDTVEIGPVPVESPASSICSRVSLEPVTIPVSAPPRYSSERGPPILSFS